MSLSAVSRATAWVIVFDASQQAFLLLKRSAKANNPHLWNFPGGGVDEGETSSIAAARELFEESGLRVSRTSLIPITTLNELHADFHLLILERTPTLAINLKESSEHRWMTLGEIRDMGKKLHKKTLAFIDKKIHRNLLRMEIRKSGVPSDDV